MKTLVRGACVLLCTSLLGNVAYALEVYRYQDDNGTVVMSRQGVPPEHVAKGYEVLNERGRVIRVVPRALTQEEYEQQILEREQAQTDKHLLRLYSQPADVDRAMERKFAEIDGLISLVRGNLHSVGVDKARLLSQAAGMERAGKPVSQQTLQEIEVLERSEDRLNQEIEQYQIRRQQVAQEFAQDKARIELLTNKK